MSMNIYVGNLPYEVKESDLYEMFVKFGEVVSAKVISDQYSGRSKGFGFVEMADKEAGQNAISALNGTEIKGRAIKVSEARAKRPKTGSGSGRGGGRGGGKGAGGFGGRGDRGPGPRGQGNRAGRERGRPRNRDRGPRS